jgi:hypothetical protein
VVGKCSRASGRGGAGFRNRDLFPRKGFRRFWDSDPELLFAMRLVPPARLHFQALSPGFIFLHFLLAGRLLATPPEARSTGAEPPRITVHPVGQQPVFGTTVTLRVTAAGTPVLRYQWWKDDQPLAGSTNGSLPLGLVQPAVSGSYRVSVSNEFGSVLSSNATVRVITAPVIVRQPVAVTSDPGGSATFSVQAIGASSLSYQWYRQGVSIPGASTASWILRNTQAADEGEYSVRAFNFFGGETSVGVPFRLSRPATEAERMPSLRYVVVPESAQVGSSAQFEVEALGGKPLRVQWHRDGEPVPGATNALWNRSGMEAGQSGSYTVTVANEFGSVTSEGRPFAVVPVPRPSNDDFTNREPLHLAPFVTGTSFNATLEALEPSSGSNRGGRSVWWNYQAPVAGFVTLDTANSGIFALVSVYTGDALENLSLVAREFSTQGRGLTRVRFHVLAGENYAVSVDDYYGSSGSIRLSSSLEPDPPGDFPPSISSQPAPMVEIPSGETLSLVVVATGSYPIRYDWTRNGRPLPSFSGPTLLITNAQPGDSGEYGVLLRNAHGQVQGSNATVRVAAIPPRLVSQPLDRSITAGYPLALSVSAVGTDPMAYQWLHDGRPIPEATNRMFIRNLVVPGRKGGFSVVVSNPVGAVTSRVAEVRVVAPGTRYRWSTLAGSGISGTLDGPGIAARLSAPSGIVRTASGDLLVADLGSGRIRKVAPDGMVSTVTDPGGRPQSFPAPVDLALDPAGKLVVLNQGRSLTRLLDDGNQASLSVTAGWGLHVDGDGTMWYTAGNEDVVVRLDTEGNRLTRTGGNLISDIGRDRNGDLLLADARSSVVRRMLADGTRSVVAGAEGRSGSDDGPAESARFAWPNSVSMDAQDNLFVADEAASTIRRVSADGVVTTVGGRSANGWSEGVGSESRFNFPRRVLAAPDGRLYVVDTANNRVRVGEPVVTVVPTLRVLRTGETLEFSWDAGDGLWVLESNDEFGNGGTWTAVDPLQDTAAKQRIPLDPVSMSDRYFRLRSP